MAATAAGAALTEGHRAAQTRTLGTLLRLFAAEWSVDVAFSGVEFVAWLNEMAPEVAAAYALSARAAERYYAAFRAAEGVPGPPVRATVPAPAVPALVEALEQYGPAYAASLVDEGLTEDKAAGRVLAQVGLTATREALAGGRDSLAAHMDADTRARGWARIARANCCAFCAMLASRGPVYRSERSAGKGRHWHRGCKCMVEPYFGGAVRLDDNAKRYADLWDKVGTGNLRDFRRALERPEVYERKQRDA